MITVAIIGYGYWGPNLVRNFMQTKVKIAFVCDHRTERLQAAQKDFSTISVTQNPDDIFNSTTIDAVIIATPVHTHFQLAKKVLEKGKHVLIEKPITTNVAEAFELIELAKKQDKIIMVDHTFLYTGAVTKMKEVIDNGEIGTINYFDSTRINLGLFQPDVNVLWDLAAHDLSILFYLLNERPVSVNATGICHTNNTIENIAYLTLNFSSNLVAHFNCSWSSPVKIRRTLIGGSKKMILYNDMEPTEKIKIYDTYYEHKTEEDKRKVLVDYRVSDIYIPKIELKEALQGVAEDFINCIENSKQPISTAELGTEIIKVLEASDVSIKNGGKEVKL